jgi:hypothetical protein
LNFGRFHLRLNISLRRASVFIGMNRYLIVPIALISLAIEACEQQPATPAAQPPSTPSPTASVSPNATASPLITPALTPEPQATPTSATETPATPAPSPSTTPDSAAPSSTASPQAATSEGRPTLSSQPANEYLRSYDAYINDFKSAYQAMKDGDVARYQSVIRRALELKAKSEKLGGELNAEEEQRFADYLNKKANELSQFASQNR